MDQVTGYMDTFIEMAIAYAPKIVLAIVVLLIGLWIIGGIVKMVGKAMERAGLDKDIQPFLKSMLGVLLKVMLLLSVAGIVGIETTSFVAVIAAAGFAIGMALQGSLGNFASGVMILLFKPYRVGDLVDVQGQIGHVEEIQIFNTLLASPDNKKVIIPNSVATSGIITNLSALEHLRVDLNIGIAGDEDFDKAKKVIEDALKSTPKVLSNPAPLVAIERFEPYYVVLAVRPYAKTADYWDVYFKSYENVKAALVKNGIRGPQPSTVVTLNK